MAFKLCLVDDENVVHTSVAAQIRSIRGVELIGQFYSGLEALRRIPNPKPDAILMDIRMPGLSGIRCTRRLKLRYPDLPVVMLTSSSQRETLLSALIAGAEGYFVKGDGKLKDVIEEVVGGGMPFSKGVAKSLRDALQKGLSANLPNDMLLTEKEQEILQYILLNERDKDIAWKLDLNLRTVEGYIRRLRQKLGVRSRKDILGKVMGDDRLKDFL